MVVWRSWRRWLALGVVGLLSAASSAASAAVPTALPAFGAGELKAEWLAGYNEGSGLDPHGVADLGLMSANNMGLYRARFRQDRVVVNGKASQWTQLDTLVRQAALKGVTILPVLINMPGEVYTPPTTAAARTTFGDFAAAAVARYGTRGSFWGACRCTPRPVAAWEIWNEPNLSVFWPNPAPAAYGQLLTFTRARIRAADPAARIVFGGLATPATPTATKLAAATFLRSTIVATGPNSFDALSIHSYYATAYPAPDYGVETGLRPVIDALKTTGANANGSPRQQVWVTEFGRQSGTSAQGAQAQYYSGFLTALVTHRSGWNLGPIIPYAFRDAADPAVARWGLRATTSDDADGGPKPAWSVATRFSIGATPVPLPVQR
jgi:hypothetical protein